MSKLALARSTGNRLCSSCGASYNDRTDSRRCPHNNVVTGENGIASPNTLARKSGEAGEAGEAGETPLLGFDGVALNGVDWFWPGWLARGKTTNLSGAGGSGKGTVAAYLMACATGRESVAGREKNGSLHRRRGLAR